MTSMNPNPARRGMVAFVLVAVGQIVSLTGSGLTGFALGAWVYQRTHSTTQFAMILVFTLLPSLIIAPLAGALVDRWDRRRVMILADAGAGLCTLAMALLLFAGQLQVWHIYIAMGLGSIFRGFQTPAYIASVSLLAPKEQLGRANGIMQFGDTSRYLFSPLLAGWLMGSIGVAGVMLIDFATFLFAVSTCLIVRFPRPKAPTTGAARQGSLGREALFGWQYIVARPGLLALLAMYALSNYATLMVDTVLPPMLLNLTTPAVVGSVLSAGGVGMLAGSVLMSAWGGPKRRIYGALGFMLPIGVSVVLMGGLTSIPLIAAATLGYYFPFPITNGCDQAIWQSKVAPDIQGRVFAIRRMIAFSVIPLAYLTAGPLADRVFEPLVANGPLAAILAPIIGVGQGRGMGLLISTMGLLVILVTVAASLYPRLRKVEDELPDVIHLSVAQANE